MMMMMILCVLSRILHNPTTLSCGIETYSGGQCLRCAADVDTLRLICDDIVLEVNWI